MPSAFRRCSALSIAVLICFFKSPAAEKPDERAEAFVMAAARGDLSAVRDFLRKGIDPNVKLPGREQDAMHMAAGEHMHEILEELLKAGAHVDGTDENYQTPLMIAADRGGKAEIDLLLKYGANIHRDDDRVMFYARDVE